MSTLSVSTITDASGGNTATINSFTPTVSNMAGRNRIINGDMRIDQRNGGASVNNQATNSYTLDRWNIYGDQASKFSVQQNAGSVTPPLGFSNYLGITSLSALSPSATDLYILRHKIEGFNIADLGWGTANAQSVTLSFWIRSSLTGTFGGVFGNGAGNRSYPFTYSIASANTWEQKTIIISGDTTGTWAFDNTIGMQIIFSIGVGTNFQGTAGEWASAGYYAPTGATSVVATNSATFYITGVQLEAGSVATPFEHRQYGHELALCQRYYEVISSFQQQEENAYASYRYLSATQFRVRKRVIPTSTVTLTYAWPNGAAVSNFGADQNNQDFVGTVDYNSINTLYNFTISSSAEL